MSPSPGYSSLMGLSTKVALIGDFDTTVIAHQAIPIALSQCGAEGVWLHTSSLRDVPAQLESFDGVWCVPASPYANMEGALDAIRFARESTKPFLGTCGGFQHAIIEFGRNVLGISDADHAESNPEASVLLISALSCPLIEESAAMLLQKDSLIRQAYGGAECIEEVYHCSFGLNPNFESQLFEEGKLRAAAHYEDGSVRVVELQDHPFYVATLFQPERRALQGLTPPLVKAFVDACVSSRA